MIVQTYFIALNLFLFLPSSQAYLTPSPRWGHAAVLVNNIVYFYGGKTGSPGVNETSAKNTNDLLVLDISAPFETSGAPWSSASTTASLQGPLISFHAISFGGSKNNQIFVYGGELDGSLANSTDTTSLYIYDLTQQIWMQPNITSPSRRFEHTMVTRADTGKIFVFGGTPLTGDTYSLDTNAISWSSAFTLQPNSPSPRFHHTSSLLSDGRMVVIGGFDGTNMINMTDIRVLDTTTLQWSAVMAIGDIPDQRRDHAAVATHDGKVIIHGGTSVDFLTFYSDIAVLDCSNSTQFVWSRPQPSGSVPPGRYTHTATMAGTNMIVAFGFLETQSGDSKIYILDTTNYTWMSSYTPSSLNYTAIGTGQSPSSSSNVGLVVGLIVAVIAILLLAFGGWWLCRRRRQQRPHDGTEMTQDNRSRHHPIPILATSAHMNGQSPPASPRSPKNVAFLAVPSPANNHNHLRDPSSDLEEQVGDMDVAIRSYLVPRGELRITNPDDRT